MTISVTKHYSAEACPDQMQIVKAIIGGELKVCSPLHIGSGFQSESILGDGGLKKEAEAALNVSAVVRGADGKPYIPGSTLRGFMLQKYRQNKSQTDIDRLFGTEKQAGLLVFSNAFLCADLKADGNHPSFAENVQTAQSIHVSIDPITRAAAEHKLYGVDYVPIGASFRIEIRTAAITPRDLVDIASLLLAIDGSDSSVLGRGVTHGRGKVQNLREQLNIRVLTSSAQLSWLMGNTDAALDAFFVDWSSSLVKEALDTCWSVEKKLSLDLRLSFSAALLINDPAFVKDKEGEPKLEFARDRKGRPLVPAKSLRGVLRAHARKIVLTTGRANSGPDSPDPTVVKAAENMVGRLFGESSRQSAIEVNDATYNGRFKPRNRVFNAVDRFTGGVANSKLYNVRVAETFDEFQCSILISERRLQSEGDWWKGLLLLLLRDLMEGDISVGWGRAKGMGSFFGYPRVKGEDLVSWKGVLESIGEPLAVTWIEALEDEILKASLLANKTNRQQ